VDKIREKSSVYQASTSLPPAVGAAGIAALKIIDTQPELRTILLSKASSLRNEIINLGYETSVSIAPVIPLFFNDRKMALDLNKWLEDSGIIVPFMNYPTANEKFILRIVVTVNHEDSQMEELLKKLKYWKFNG